MPGITCACQGGRHDLCLNHQHCSCDCHQHLMVMFDDSSPEWDKEYPQPYLRVVLGNCFFHMDYDLGVMVPQMV